MLRLGRRLTQLEMARRLGMSQGTYSLIETGYREADEDEQRAIAKLLHVDTSDLGFDAPVAEVTE